MASGESIEFTIFILKFPYVFANIFLFSILAAIGQVNKLKINLNILPIIHFFFNLTSKSISF